ncbi:MAG: hypothetical protein H0W70_12810, partial [Actinobacteria bacterium]|nr:hypothetical protein [Actinomycetota bacterium]
VAESAASAALACIGGLVAYRRRESPIGWLLLAIGVETGLTQLSYRYGLRYVLPAGMAAPLPESLNSTDHLEDGLVPGLAGLLFLLFPTGHPPSPRWRPLTAATIAVAAVSVAASVVTSGQLADLPGVVNPLGIRALASLTTSVRAISVPLVNMAFILGGLSLIARWRRAEGVERQQIKWLAAAATLLAALLLIGRAVEPLSGVFFFGVLAIPVAVAIAVLRYRLNDIDVVISRAVVFGMLAGFVTIVYVGVVVGFGALISTNGRPSVLLSIVATAVTAVAFQPMRTRAEHLANRVVYGQRSTPYEVLARFAEQLGDATDPQEQLQLLASLLSEGTGGDVRVWLRVGDRLRLTASSRSGDEVPSGEVDRSVPVVHHGTTLGLLTLVKPANEQVSSLDDRLMMGMAGQAGLVMRNARLAAELYERLDQLQLSRQRLVAAQDDERRRLERDLHDGAQQQLVALKIKLGIAGTLATRESAPRTSAAIGELVAEAGEAVDTLRELAHGIYPPLLAAEGLAAALGAHTTKTVVPIELSATDLGRYSQDVEAAVYFCCLEALQNISKYAQATAVRIDLTQVGSSLVFSVADDGKGFDAATVRRGAGLQNMEDRIGSVGGTLTLASAPSAGCTVSGHIPVAVA